MKFEEERILYAFWYKTIKYYLGEYGIETKEGLQLLTEADRQLLIADIANDIVSAVKFEQTGERSSTYWAPVAKKTSFYVLLWLRQFNDMLRDFSYLLVFGAITIAVLSNVLW